MQEPTDKLSDAIYKILGGSDNPEAMELLALICGEIISQGWSPKERGVYGEYKG